MTHVVHLEKVYFLFFNLLKCLVSCQFLKNIHHMTKMHSELWLVILRNGLGSKFTFFPRRNKLNSLLVGHNMHEYGEYFGLS